MKETNQASATVPTWTLGWRLQRALGFADIPVGVMAEELGVNRGTMSRWLNDRGPVREVYLRYWAERCGVPFEWLKNGDEASADHSRNRRRSDRHVDGGSIGGGEHSTCSAPFAGSTTLIAA